MGIKEPKATFGPAGLAALHLSAEGIGHNWTLLARMKSKTIHETFFFLYGFDCWFLDSWVAHAIHRPTDRCDGRHGYVRDMLPWSRWFLESDNTVFDGNIYSCKSKIKFRVCGNSLLRIGQLRPVSNWGICLERQSAHLFFAIIAPSRCFRACPQ